MLKVSESKEIAYVTLCVHVYVHALKCLCVHVRVWGPEVDTGTFLCHSPPPCARITGAQPPCSVCNSSPRARVESALPTETYLQPL